MSRGWTIESATQAFNDNDFFMALAREGDFSVFHPQEEIAAIAYRTLMDENFADYVYLAQALVEDSL